MQFRNQNKKQETSAWQQRSIARSKLEINFENNQLNCQCRKMVF